MSYVTVVIIYHYFSYYLITGGATRCKCCFSAFSLLPSSSTKPMLAADEVGRRLHDDHTSLNISTNNSTKCKHIKYKFRICNIKTIINCVNDSRPKIPLFFTHIININYK